MTFEYLIKAAFLIACGLASVSSVCAVDSEVRIYPISVDGVAVQCRLVSVKAGVGIKAKITGPLTVVVSQGERVRVGLSCALPGRPEGLELLAYGEVLFPREGPKSTVARIQVTACTRDLAMEFLADTIQGRIVGALGAPTSFRRIVMIQEATGEVRSAPVDAEGQFAISVRCEGKYLATFMDDQRTKGVWRLSIGVMDKALVLPVAKMTNVSSEVIPSSR